MRNCLVVFECVATRAYYYRDFPLTVFGYAVVKARFITNLLRAITPQDNTKMCAGVCSEFYVERHLPCNILCMVLVALSLRSSKRRVDDKDFITGFVIQINCH